MKAHALRRTTMEENTLSIANMLLVALNVVFGMVSSDLNLLVALFGILATLAANVIKIIIAFQELKALAKNKWKKPPPPANNNEKKDS